VDDVEHGQIREMQLRDEALARQARIAAAFAQRDPSVNGICIDCGCAIDPKRLAAISTARCVDCANIFEAKLRGVAWK